MGVIGRALIEMCDYRDYVLYQGHRLPPRDLRSRMCGNALRSDDFYLGSAVVEATRLVARLGYTKKERIVDVGCGLGRLATGLLAEYGDVPYLGLDANGDFLAWCQKHIARGHPTFRFMHYDVMNPMYNPDGTVDGTQIRLPLESGSTDIVYLWGVFTNMALEHVRIYVGELSRIVRDGGRVFVTAWVEDDVPDVTYNPPGYVPWRYRGPLAVVRYSRSWLFAQFQQHGLLIDEFRHHGGMWSKQSEIYLSKAPARAALHSASRLLPA